MRQFQITVVIQDEVHMMNDTLLLGRECNT